MKVYVIENRGCDINYVVFSGTLRECNEWMRKNTIPHPLNGDIFISLYDEDVNGNGDPFTYTIEEDF